MAEKKGERIVETAIEARGAERGPTRDPTSSLSIIDTAMPTNSASLDEL
jgi:hypothetical protein